MKNFNAFNGLVKLNAYLSLSNFYGSNDVAGRRKPRFPMAPDSVGQFGGNEEIRKENRPESLFIKK